MYLDTYMYVCTKQYVFKGPAERIYVYNLLLSSSTVRSLPINVIFGQEAEQLFEVITTFSFTTETKHEIHSLLNS